MVTHEQTVETAVTVSATRRCSRGRLVAQGRSDGNDGSDGGAGGGDAAKSAEHVVLFEKFWCCISDHDTHNTSTSNAS